MHHKQIKRGANAIDNWKLLSEANQNDTLFHLYSLPSCYVIIECPMSLLSKQDIDQCATICISKSKYKHCKPRVFYTEINNLQKGKNVGEIIIKSNHKIKII